MKMVSAAKLKGDENRLYTARPFNKWAEAITGPSTELNFQVDVAPTFEEIPDNCLIVPITSDKGLCGGVNSFISRGIRGMVQTLSKDGKKSSICVVGDKGRSQMRRMVGDHLVAAATEVIVPGNFDLGERAT